MRHDTTLKRPQQVAPSTSEKRNWNLFALFVLHSKKYAYDEEKVKFLAGQHIENVEECKGTCDWSGYELAVKGLSAWKATFPDKVAGLLAPKISPK